MVAVNLDPLRHPLAWRVAGLLQKLTPTLGPSERPVSDLVDRITRGEKPTELGLEPLDIVAALVYEALRDNGPNLVQGPPKNRSLIGALSEAGIKGLYPAIGRPQRLAISAGLLQIHDFWDESHTAAQLADDMGEASVSQYWHVIAHRREPDHGNAAYWLRRVGHHFIHPTLAEWSTSSLSREDALLASKLSRGGRWDASAFLAICDPRNKDTARIAREIQINEMLLLMEASLPS